MDERRTRAVDRAGVVASDYLGDGVYVAYDGFGMWLTAEDGVRATDGIYLEPLVYNALRQFWLSLDYEEKRKVES